MMKALNLLTIYKDLLLNETMIDESEITEAIAEGEGIKDILLEKDEALAIERLMYKKLLEKNKELSDQLALNNPFENRSCDSCKYWNYQFTYSLYKSCTFGLIEHSYEESSFSCNKWEPK